LIVDYRLFTIYFSVWFQFINNQLKRGQVIFMNTLWVKVAVIGVVLLGLVILVISFLPKDSQPQSGSNSVYEQWEKDDARLRAGPEPVVEEPPAEQENPPEPAAANEPTAGNTSPKPPTPTEVTAVPQFVELSLEQKVQAEKLFEMALFHSKQGRLPVMTYKKMVDYCREIIQRWPDSEYAFKAKRMLRHMPERYRARYDITQEEIDLGGLK
jgi:hypothetical protein